MGKGDRRRTGQVKRKRANHPPQTVDEVPIPPPEKNLKKLTEEEKLEIASKRFLKQHKPAFEELAKN